MNKLSILIIFLAIACGSEKSEYSCDATDLLYQKKSTNDQFDTLEYVGAMSSNCAKMVQNNSGDLELKISVISEKMNGYVVDFSVSSTTLKFGNTKDYQLNSGTVTITQLHTSKYRDSAHKSLVMPWNDTLTNFKVHVNVPVGTDSSLHPSSVTIDLRMP